jgi:hypothetical protein
MSPQKLKQLEMGKAWRSHLANCRKRVARSVKFFDVEAMCEEKTGRASWKAMLGGGTQDEAHEETSPEPADLAGVLADPGVPDGVAGDEDGGREPAGSLAGSVGLVAEDTAREGDPAVLCGTVAATSSEEVGVEPQPKQAKLARFFKPKKALTAEDLEFVKVQAVGSKHVRVKHPEVPAGIEDLQP